MKSQNTEKVRISSKVLNSNMKRPRKKPLKPQRSCVPSLYGYASYRKVWCHLRKREQLCDGVIRTVDGEVIGVHRALLSAISPYFKAVFTNILQGGIPERTEVTVDISKTVLETILDYAYTGHCRVSSANVEDLLSAADRYEVLGVVDRCCYFLKCAMNSKNCLGISKFARLFCCVDLKNDAEKYILEKFHDVRQESLEFYELTACELRDILENDNLNVRSEEAVFEAVAAWVSWNAPERKIFLPQLISCPRYGLMNEHYFWKVVQQYPRITENSDLQNSLYPASLFLAKLDSKRGSEVDLNDPVARPRIPYEILFAIGGWSAGSPTSFVETYDTRADRWFLSVNTDVTPRAYHGLCALDSLIYMIGGFDGNEHFNSVRCFNPITRKWKERACMYHARCYVSVCTLGGRIYAMGGYNGRTRMNSAERYNPNSNQWEIIPSMQRQRSDASAAALNDKIYIVGGFNGQEVLSSAEMFDPLTNQWSYIHPMTSARSGVSLVAYKGCLYALGGFNGFTRLNTGEKYDPSQSLDWHEVTEMFSPRSNFATVVLDDMIFVIGGFNGTTTIAYVECYDAETNEWYDASPMNLNRSALSACVIPGLPNAREYSYLSKAQEIGQGASSDAASH